MTTLDLPPPALGIGEPEAQARFDALQRTLVPLWESIQTMTLDEQTIIVVPSLNVDFELYGTELQAYEERFLFLLLLLRQPSARLVYVTSQPIQPCVIEYYLNLLPGVILSHARKRLFLVAPQDSSSKPLALKLLERPNLVAEMRALIKDPTRAHLVPFNTTNRERDLALALGIPMYGADPRHMRLGTKSGCRRLFREIGIPLPEGVEGVRSRSDVLDALAEVKRRRPSVRQVMVKHDDGVSGEGNAVVDLHGIGADPSRAALEERLAAIRLEAPYLGVDGYFKRLEKGGIVEERIVAEMVASPSVQLRVTPLGKVELLSTHDQLLSGPQGQTFVGCVFPADRSYAVTIARAAEKVGQRLADEGVLGRFGIDFVVGASAGEPPAVYAIELNLRKGGTTHPFLTLQFLTDGRYDGDSATYRTRLGQQKCFVATDKFQAPELRVFSAESVFDVAVKRGLHFDQARGRGVVFHMLAALGDHGRLGMTAVGDSHAEARELFDRTQRELLEEARRSLSLPLLP